MYGLLFGKLLRGIDTAEEVTLHTLGEGGEGGVLSKVKYGEL
jgi:hypothetical protein